MAHGKAEELTGRRRYRRGYDHDEVDPPEMMVLQVEVSYFDYQQRKWSVKWRDATPADLPDGELV